MADELEVCVICADTFMVRARVCGEADLDTSWRLRDVLEPALSPGVALVLEVDRLEFIDSWAVSELIFLAKTATSRGGCMRVANPTAAVERVLEVSGLIGLLGVHHEPGERREHLATA